MVIEKGTLKDISAMKLLLTIFEQALTGILYIKRANILKVLYFNRGKMIWAISNSDVDKLENILAAKDLVPMETINKVKKEGKISDSVGKLLVAKGLIILEELIECSKEQLRRIIISVLKWKDGSFQFTKDAPPERLLSLDLDITQFVIEYIVEEVDVSDIWKEIGSLQVEFIKNPDEKKVARYHLSDKQTELLNSFDGEKKLEPILSRHSGGHRDSLLKIVYFFLTAQLLIKKEFDLSVLETFDVEKSIDNLEDTTDEDQLAKPPGDSMSLESLEIVEPGEPTEHMEPVESAEPVEPAEDIEDFDPVVNIEDLEAIEALKPSRSTKPIDMEPLEPIKHKEPVEPIEPPEDSISMESLEPVEPIEHKEPVESVEPPEDSISMEPLEPVEPIEIEGLEPIEHKEPVEPGEPAEDGISIESIEPVEPIEHRKPLEPIEPMEPAEPIEHKEPVEPIEIEGLESIEDMEPVEPIDSGPLEPIEPDEPMEPIDRVEPEPEERTTVQDDFQVIDRESEGSAEETFKDDLEELDSTTTGHDEQSAAPAAPFAAPPEEKKRLKVFNIILSLVILILIIGGGILLLLTMMESTETEKNALEKDSQNKTRDIIQLEETKPPVKEDAAGPGETGPDKTSKPKKPGITGIDQKQPTASLVPGKTAKAYFREGNYIIAGDVWKQEIIKSGVKYGILLELDCMKASVKSAYNRLPSKKDFYILNRGMGSRTCFLVMWGKFFTHEQATEALKSTSIPTYFWQQKDPPGIIELSKYL